VRGVELVVSIWAYKYLRFYGALTCKHGVYVEFTNSPPPLEETSGDMFKNISGGELPGISKWAGSLNWELSNDGKLLDKKGQFYLAPDSYYRSSFSSNP